MGFLGIGPSGQEKAQQLANETNYAIANEANYWNRWNMEYQNEWNLQRRDEEWAYNDPANQMDRMIKAGINPILAIGSLENSPAQQLTSAQASPWQTAHMEPVYDSQAPAKLGNLITATRDVMNQAQGFYKLALESEDVKTRRSAQEMDAMMKRAEIAYKKSMTEGQNLFNGLTVSTYSTQVKQKVADYEETQARIKKFGQDSELTGQLIENAKVTKDQIIKMTDYIGSQARAVEEGIRQKWRELSIQQQNANTNSVNAESNVLNVAGNLYYRGKEYKFNEAKFIEEYKQKSTSELLRMMEQQRQEFDKLDLKGKIFSAGQDYIFGNESKDLLSHQLDRVEYFGTIFKSRVEDDPTKENVEAYQEYLNVISDIYRSIPFKLNPSNVNTSNSTVLNPSGF